MQATEIQQLTKGEFDQLMAERVRVRVGEILEAKNISVPEFAQLARLNYRTALEIANDRYLRYGKDTIGKICKALDVTPGEIFVYEEDAD